MKNVFVSAMILAFATLSFAEDPLFVQQARPPLDSMTLAWAPTIPWTAPDSLGFAGVKAKTFALRQFTDARGGSKNLGVFTGKKNNKPPRIVSSKDDICQWNKTHLYEGLRSYGIPIAPDTAEYMIDVEIDTFAVVETDQYRGRIVLKMIVTKSSTGAKWTGTVMGGYELWGLKFRGKNFSAALSNSIVAAGEQIVKALPKCIESLDKAQ